MRTLRAAAALATALVLAPAAATALPLDTVRYDAAATARLYALVDGHRRAAGLPSLTRDARLERIARGWTLTMATTGRLAHNDSLFTKATHALLGITTFGENVAYASRGVDRAHETLLDSPHHRENIESRAYAVSGFAVVVDGKGVTWVTEDFGSRPAARVAPAPRPPAAVPTRTAPRTAAPARSAPVRAPRATAPRPAAPRATTPSSAPGSVPGAAPAVAAPAWVPPAFPLRESTTDRVDPASGAAVPAVAVAARRTASTPVVPVAAGLAALTVAVLATATLGRRRSATLEP